MLITSYFMFPLWESLFLCTVSEFDSQMIFLLWCFNRKTYRYSQDRGSHVPECIESSQLGSHQDFYGQGSAAGHVQHRNTDPEQLEGAVLCVAPDKSGQESSKPVMYSMLIIFWTNLIKSHSVRRRTTIGKRGAALEWPWWVKSQSHCRWVKILFFVGLRVYLHLFLFHLSVCLFICLFVYLSACLSDYLDVYLPDHLAVCPVVSLSCTISRGCFHGWEYFPYII